jgi:hypothetical protein
VVLFLEHVHVVLETHQDGGDVFEVVFLEGLKLFDGAEKLLKLSDSAAEEIELSKNLVGAKVELFGLRNILKTFLGEFVLLHICLMEIKTSLESGD